VTSGSLGGAFALTDRLTLAANVGRGFRAPTLFELYADGVHAGVAAVQQGNADLDPEKSLNTDLSLRWRSPRVRASATVYRNAIDEYIFLADTGASQGGLPVFAYRQDDATLTGIELAVRGDVTESIEVSATYDAVDGENDATREELPLQPADEFRLETTWRPSGWAWLASPYVRFGVRHNAAKDASPGEPFAQFDNAPFGTASTDAYTVADVAFGFALGRSGNDAARFDLTIRNVTDETYRDFLDTYKGYALSPGRDVRLELRVPFGA
jgi:iron complex outermembrane receptor protein/hemoglobin/transferrin/lactoferrin receptor protein